MSDIRHVIKHEYKDGEKLSAPTLWCGRKADGSWCFTGASHVSLAVGGSVQPCKDCIKAIIKELEKEL